MDFQEIEEDSRWLEEWNAYLDKKTAILKERNDRFEAEEKARQAAFCYCQGMDPGRHCKDGCKCRRHKDYVSTVFDKLEDKWGEKRKIDTPSASSGSAAVTPKSIRKSLAIIRCATCGLPHPTSSCRSKAWDVGAMGPQIFCVESSQEFHFACAVWWVETMNVRHEVKIFFAAFW